MTGKLDALLQFHQQALDLRAYRQQLLASNIANADTPGYKAKDIDFAAALQGAMAGGAGAAKLKVTSERHLGGAADPAPAGVQVRYRTPQQPSVDGNTVEMDVERMQFADNAIRYEASLSFINGKIKTLLSAIQG